MGIDKDSIRDYELDIIVKAWRDERFRRNLLKDAKKSIEAEFGVVIPDDMNIFVHEENENSLHFIVPSLPSNFAAEDLSDDELKEVIGGVVGGGHSAFFPSNKEKLRLQNVRRENEQLKKMIEKLSNDLSELEEQILKG